MDEKTIDIHRYLGCAPGGKEGGAFSVWGGEGMRARFALPVWRAIHLLEGERGGIVQLPSGEDVPRPFFLMDLTVAPARTDCLTEPLIVLRKEDPPALVFNARGELAVLLGEDESGLWFLQVVGGSSKNPLEGERRETLLFLAGECAGLLFFRELSRSDP